MGQGSGVSHKDVVRHLSRRDAFLRWMCASHGVPVEASTNSCGEKLAIEIAQRQWAKALRCSNSPSIVVDVGGLGDKDRSTFGKMLRNSTSFQHILTRTERPTLLHICKRHTELPQRQEQIPSLKQ